MILGYSGISKQIFPQTNQLHIESDESTFEEMADIREIFQPLSFDEFLNGYYLRQPFASPASALGFRKLIGWPLLSEIFETGYADCWLAKNGRLAESGSNTGQLDFAHAHAAFLRGESIVVRHSERAHPALTKIADDFHDLFHDPIDIQLYATPEGKEGFDWHYDLEDVFVIQSSGEKEFRLRVPHELPSLAKVVIPETLEFSTEKYGPEIQCQVSAGDVLYIPAGVWHKARAITPSFHLSVGVMAKERSR